MYFESTSTATATMAYPSLPASPTLTNPDMILPYGEYDSTPSPPQHAFRPQSPGKEWGDSRTSNMEFSIGPPHTNLGASTPTTPIIYGNGTMLSDIGEVTEAESMPGRKLPGPAERRLLKQAHGTSLRSSPTIGSNGVKKRTRINNHERKFSVESASTITSDVPANGLFEDFDDGVSVDDSNFQGDDEGSVADSYSEEVIAMETQRLSRKESSIGRDEDRNSSAALSRRAEQILLNAKKRLNNMEGNLTRARSSLYFTRSGSVSSIHSSSPLSRSTPSPQMEQRNANQGFVPPAKHRQHQAPSEQPNGSPGHSRVYSENSIPSTLRSGPFPIRSASAAAGFMGRGVGGGSQRSPPPITHSPDNIREEGVSLSRSGFALSSSKTSPTHNMQLEPLSEYDAVPEFEGDLASVKSSTEEDYVSGSAEHRVVPRSASSMQMRDLRDQMHDLKGRLSVLRDQARDDTMKRRSLQSLRTPSPFTAAEQWYTAAKGYKEEGLSADAGAPHAPWSEEMSHVRDSAAGENFARQTPVDASSVVTSVYEDVSEGHPAADGVVGGDESRILEDEGRNENVEDDHREDSENDIENDYMDEIIKDGEFDDYESDASLYHDTLATPISHEDREDAFDYEHFFLHSAMGTINQHRLERRDSIGSFSSEDSVETTRGPSNSNLGNGHVDERTALGHLRSMSTDSISTVATFATATEKLGTENNTNEDQSDYAVQHVKAPVLRSSTPVTAKRSTFGSMDQSVLLNDHHSTTENSEVILGCHDEKDRNRSSIHRPSVDSFGSFESTGTTRSFPLVNKPKSQQSMTRSRIPDSESLEQDGPILINSKSLIEGPFIGSGDHLQPSPVQMLVRDDQILVERLVASLGKCVLGLQEAGRASQEGRMWRRRLDAARRVLEGQEGAI